jgi:putative DNA primase/helicase
MGRRGILDLLPAGAAGDALRFHPACPFAGTKTPAMVALVRNIRTDEPQAIHRTAIDMDGNKAYVEGKCRMALGPVAGGAIKLTEDADVTTCLGIGEGMETVLSMRAIPEFGLSPVWSLISAGGIEAFPVLEGIECLHIAVDNDPHGRGLQAGKVCRRRWKDAGREVFRVETDCEGTDLNDVI